VQRAVVKKAVLVSLSLLLLLTLGVGAFREYVACRRDPERWGAHSMTYGRWCIQNYRDISLALDCYCSETGSRRCPETWEALLAYYGINKEPEERTILYCPLARKNGKIGRFVWTGAGKEWNPAPTRRWDAAYKGQEPIIFDYPDNHPEGGYALFVDGDIAKFDAASWKTFLDEHLPKDFRPENNDLKWWQWEPRK
jgi:hypothetical protein